MLPRILASGAGTGRQPSSAGGAAPFLSLQGPVNAGRHCSAAHPPCKAAVLTAQGGQEEDQAAAAPLPPRLVLHTQGDTQ